VAVLQCAEKIFSSSTRSLAASSPISPTPVQPMKVETLAPIVTTPITTTLLRTALTTTILTTTQTSSPLAMPLVAMLTDKVFFLLKQYKYFCGNLFAGAINDVISNQKISKYF
jgi:hypothetical protein